MNVYAAEQRTAPSAVVQHPDRHGYIQFGERFKGSMLPSVVYWAFVDKDDAVQSGALGILPDDRFGGNRRSSEIYVPYPDEQEPVFGDALEVASELNWIFNGAWVDVPNTISSPLVRLFDEVRLTTSWRCIDPWGHCSIGPWAELVIDLPDLGRYIPAYPGIHEMPVRYRAEAYVLSFRSARRAHQQLTKRLLSDE